MDFRLNNEAFITEAPFGELQVSGNPEQGYRPYQLLVSSIAVCSGGVFRKIMEKQRIPFTDIQIHADVTRNEEEPQEITAVHLHFKVAGDELKEHKIEKALQLTYKHCSMVQSVKDSIKVTETFELV
ncbi:putative OsmC-like protein [Salsuginibacillus halophilus]|uniref:Putative OsmC-like protein n=1 Tax=Salsuginibacillus halophilus TaxID=517424 RepID=A0A2P8HBI9_9BACI|nr:OsmC family protein [Salsuginibacillus halophilus]PSL43595.1 putative OsmC-like protein [Salsuginibacillus halophilus]